MTNDDDAMRRAAQRLLSEGYATPAELANAMGRSRQAVLYWAKGIGWKQARERRIKVRLAELTRLYG